MVIDKSLFGACYCPTAGIGRVCLNENRGIPQFLEDYGREKDGDEYDAGCFSIDIILKSKEPVGGIINYMAENEMWSEIICDNYLEAWVFYREHANPKMLKEAMEEF